MRPRQLNMESTPINEQLLKATQKIQELEAKVNHLEQILEVSQKKVKTKDLLIGKLESSLEFKDKTLKKLSFTYDELHTKPALFKYMCGLTVEQFDLLWSFIAPYVHLITYDETALNNKVSARLLHQKSELLIVLTCCKHGLNLGISGWMAGISESSMQRLFNAWMIFLASLFGCINLKPAPGFLKTMMPKIFVKTGHRLTDQLGDCTEFKLQNASNYDLNSLTFSDYKNTTTAKAYIGIAPHSGGLIFSDLYPGSISDSEITELSSATDFIQEGHEFMTDKGFCIQEYCASKGIFHNRPAMKFNDQFEQVDIADNFDIASLRIDVEQYIGRVRDWSILNRVWPVPRMDLLNCTWKVLCHIVNTCCEPIGPKS